MSRKPSAAPVEETPAPESQDVLDPEVETCPVDGNVKSKGEPCGVCGN